HILGTTYALVSRNLTPDTMSWRDRLTRQIRTQRPDMVSTDPEHADLVIVLGGDGTLIDVLQSPLAPSARILALNTGHSGFLCSARTLEEFEELLGCALNGELEVMEIPLLEISHRSNTDTTIMTAVNDILL